MDSEYGLKLIEQATDKDTEEKLYAMYVHIYPLMVRGEIEHKNFNDFLKQTMPGKRDNKGKLRKKVKQNKEQVMSKVEYIMNNYKF